MTTDAIRTEGLTKYYGDVRGVEDLDLTVHQGEVFGFLGPNGAGKTTTIRLLLDLLRPTRGRAEVLGFDAREDALEVQARVGYLPGELALPEHLTARELLHHLGELRGGIPQARVEALAERLDLDLTRPTGDLSQGNKRKVGIVQAFAPEPDLLVLDEPTGGLDPLMQDTFLDLVREVRDAGRTVFLSSHVLSEVERVADRVGILRDGHLVVVEDVHALREQAQRQLLVHLAEDVDPERFQDVPGVTAVQRESAKHLRFRVDGHLDALVKALAEHEVVNIVSHETDLEEIFRTYYREDA